jgi:hypothetical protein
LETQSVMLENQRAVLKRIVRVIVANRDSLGPSVKEKRLDKLSWAVRNLVELVIWAEYCAATPVNAQRFVLDAARDAMDAMKTAHKISSKGSDILDFRRDLIRKAKEDGFTTIDASYARVADVAKSIGRLEMFAAWNKTLSKFAHPTAFSVLTDMEQAEKILLEKFLCVGEQLASIALSFAEPELRTN